MKKKDELFARYINQVLEGHDYPYLLDHCVYYVCWKATREDTLPSCPIYRECGPFDDLKHFVQSAATSVEAADLRENNFIKELIKNGRKRSPNSR